MPDKRNDTRSPSARQAADDSIALAIGTRCEECHAPAWPIASPCRYCAEARKAAERMEARPNPIAARLHAAAANACSWPRDIPTPPGGCICEPCTARRVLAMIAGRE